MTEGVIDVVAEWPAADESLVVREDVTLLTREMLLTASADMAVVRIFGSDRSGNAVRLGVSPERALRIGAAFIRAGLRIKPGLRAQVVDETINNAIAAPPTTGEGGRP